MPPRPATSARRHRRLRPLNPVQATPYVEQLSIGAGRRLFAIGLAVLIPALLLLLLLIDLSVAMPLLVGVGAGVALDRIVFGTPDQTDATDEDAADGAAGDSAEGDDSRPTAAS